MYDAAADRTCYSGSAVLINLAGLRSQADLDLFETVATGRRFAEPMPIGRFGIGHFKAVHRHIFQDVYRWAGRPRTVRVSKGESTFCYPEHIDAELRRVFAWLEREDRLRGRDVAGLSAGIAHLAAELNAVHAFRDGNGRVQLAFSALLADHAGHPFDLTRLEPREFLAAMIASFRGDERGLARQFEQLVVRPQASRRSPGS